jgi:Sulfotransferase family
MQTMYSTLDSDIIPALSLQNAQVNSTLPEQERKSAIDKETDYRETKLLIIAGMHRSGTSLITQWLQKCGLNIGDELMVPNKSNKQGYFEDMDFVKLHEDLLSQNGLPYTGITHKTIPKLTSIEKEKIFSLLNRKNLSHKQWGWKDPRTCLFLDTYRELAPGAKYIIIYRDCNFCVCSLISRMLRDEEDKYLATGKKTSRLKWQLFKKSATLKHFLQNHAEDFSKVWIHYNKELLYHTELRCRKQCIVLDYHFLLANDKKLFGFLTSDWNFDLTYSPFGDVFKKNLMSKWAPISDYIKDKNLLFAASKLENKLKAISF